MPCAPLRILCNQQNFVRTATLTPSSVTPAASTVLEIPAARIGTAGVTLTGAYTGSENATLDIEILDDTADTKRASTPVLIGQGTGTLTDIAFSGFAAQDVIVELKDAGIPIQSAALDIEGVKLVAAASGASGNDIHLNVDAGIDSSPAGLVFAPTAYSLLVDVAAGQGGPTTGLVGAGYDWGQPALGEDGVIPASAPRVAFGDDTSAVYTAYKRFANGAWGYYLVPALLRAVPKNTAIKFVTGGRTVTVRDGNSPGTVETYTNIVTVYDLLHKIREGSVLVSVTGVVANDRTPTGQAARDLLVRTDAHVEPSYGTGSSYATGVETAYAEVNAGTENVTLRCYAVTGRDHPLAHLGSERWEVNGTLSGALAHAVTGVAYVADKFGFLIPRKLPPGYGSAKGSISATITYATRAGVETEPPICPVALTLGSDPVDQTVTFIYTARPTGDCQCDSMPIPNLSDACLGVVTDGGGNAMAYQQDTVNRLRDLREWFVGVVRAVSIYVPGDDHGLQAPIISIPNNLTYGVSTVVTSQTQPLTAVVDNFERVLVQIDALEITSPGLRVDGMNEWDAAVTELQSDLATIIAAESGTETAILSIPTDQYSERLKAVLSAAGISAVGGADAGILESGDGCWRDFGGAYWWEVEGTEGGGYAPAFTNQPFYSSRRSTVDGKFYSTREFGLQINVLCTADLKVGDTVTVTIGGSTWPATYQVGDEIVLPIIAAGDLYLAGGQDGNTVQVWNVRGSVAGPLANYTLDTASPTAYSASGLGFQITEGGIPFVIGDRFTFSAEGGHFQWRVNGGAWNLDSPPLDIPTGALSLYAGLSATFTPGEAPSFAAGDVYSFRILQPRSASNLQTPGPEAWQWVADDQAIDVDLGSSKSIANLAIALHTLPAGCTITVEGSASGGSPFADWTETLTRVEGPIYKELAAVRTARYLRLTLNDAPSATIGWFFAGAPITTTLSADLSLSRAWKIDRGAGGLYQGGRYLGKAVAGDIEWSEGALPEADVTALQAMLDWVKSHDDEPIIVVPNYTRPTEAFLGRPAADEVEFEDVFRYGPNAGKARRHSTRIPIAGVWS